MSWLMTLELATPPQHNYSANYNSVFIHSLTRPYVVAYLGSAIKEDIENTPKPKRSWWGNSFIRCVNNSQASTL